MIKNKKEGKIIAKHISCGCKCKFNSTTCNSNQKWNNKTCQCECKNCHMCKKDLLCICENKNYVKGITDTSVIACDETISVTDIASTKKTNTITANVTENCHGEKVRYKIDCYFLNTVLLAVILPLITTIIYYHYAKHRSKQKGVVALII